MFLNYIYAAFCHMPPNLERIGVRVPIIRLGGNCGDLKIFRKFLKESGGAMLWKIPEHAGRSQTHGEDPGSLQNHCLHVLYRTL